MVTLENADMKRRQAEKLKGYLVRLPSLDRDEMERAERESQKLLFDNLFGAFGFEVGWAEGEGVTDEKLLEMFRACKNTRFVGISETVLLPLVKLVLGLGSVSGSATSKVDSALVWVYLGLARLHMYIPSSPLDPGTKPAAKVAQREKEVS